MFRHFKNKTKNQIRNSPAEKRNDVKSVDKKKKQKHKIKWNTLFKKRFDLNVTYFY